MATFREICIRKKNDENTDEKRPIYIDMTYSLTDGYVTALWTHHPKFKDLESGISTVSFSVTPAPLLLF